MSYIIKALKAYAVFSGRSRRSEFWFFFLFYVVVNTIFNVIGGAIEFPLLGSLATLAIIVPYLAVGVRRMHDVGKPGWFLLIPIYNIILAATVGVSGQNEYGPDPKV